MSDYDPYYYSDVYSDDDYTYSGYHCPFSGVPFTFVYPDGHADADTTVTSFMNFATPILSRLNSGEVVNISIDCEGSNLGVVPGGLKMVQLAECFRGLNLLHGDSIRFTPDSEILSSDGFLVICPPPALVKQALVDLISHPNTMLLTCDLTCDFSSLRADLGAKPELAHAVDAQLAFMKDSQDPNSANLPGLSTIVRNHRLYSTIELYKMYSGACFSLSMYLFGANAWNKLFAQRHIIEYAAGDVFLTALACSYALNPNNINDVIRKTKERASVGSAIRRRVHFSSRKLPVIKNIAKIHKFLLSGEHDLPRALDIHYSILTFQLAHSRGLKVPLSSSQLAIAATQVSAKLDDWIDVLEEKWAILCDLDMRRDSLTFLRNELEYWQKK